MKGWKGRGTIYCLIFSLAVPNTAVVMNSLFIYTKYIYNICVFLTLMLIEWLSTKPNLLYTHAQVRIKHNSTTF